MKGVMKMQKEILDLFKVVVLNEGQVAGDVVFDNALKGFVTNFVPTADQLAVLKENYKPLNVNTLFTVEERESGDLDLLLTRQLLHYIEVYGLNAAGLFDLEVSDGQVATLVYVRGVTEAEFGEMVRTLLYVNAPVKDSNVLRDIIRTHNVEFDINKVQNNELRVLLFDPFKHQLNNGDDVVRYIVTQATDQGLLIKSPEVIAAVTEYATKVPLGLLESHAEVLAQVFNRHKKILLALKNKSTRTVLNRISRLSKTKHVPIREAINKTFVGKALNGEIKDFSVLDKISIRDKFKFLNLLEYRKEGLSTDAFVVRNGKMHIEKDRKVYKDDSVYRVTYEVLDSLKKDLESLKDKNILLDEKVHYGLPVSRKQTLGSLPFGTEVSVDSDQISSGMYWENDWGSRDLDLSTIDKEGNRTGWGHCSGYDQSNPITFSGDLVDARDGAMEFMTSKANTKSDPYGLFVNIFAGEIGSKMKIVVGEKTDKHWIQNPVINEEHTLDSRGNIIGFVRDGKFVVFSCRLNNRRANFGGNASLIARGLAGNWTINRLFDVLDIKYDIDKDLKKVYDYDLTYEKYTSDSLEEIFS